MTNTKTTANISFDHISGTRKQACLKIERPGSTLSPTYSSFYQHELEKLVRESDSDQWAKALTAAKAAGLRPYF